MKILILCTGNSCRSQMTHGVMKSLGDDIEVFSAGSDIFVMNEFRRVRDEIRVSFTNFYEKIKER